MKIFTALASLAALVAFVLLPHTLPVAASLVFGACLIAIFAADYTRTAKRLMVPSKAVTFPRSPRRVSALELAA